MTRSLAPLAALLCAMALLAAGEARTAAKSKHDRAPGTSDAPAASASTDQQAYTTETLVGKVVWLEKGLQQLFGVTADPQASETAVALVTADGWLWPIVPDVRGHAFALDERLRDIELQLLVRRYDRAPLVQVIRVLKRKADGKLYEVDYWCDICSIPMFTKKPCDCCQGETRLRERPVEDARPGG